MKSLAITATALCLAATSVAAQDWSVELYGGFTPKSSLKYGGTSFKTDNGHSIGLGIYNRGMVSNVELGVDIMSTSVGYTGFGSGVDSVSLMGVGRYVFPIATGTQAYLGAGLGAIRVKYDGGAAFAGFTGHKTVAGGMIEAGVRADIGQGAQVFGAVRHQMAFSSPTIVGTVQSFRNTSLLVGVSFRF